MYIALCDDHPQILQELSDLLEQWKSTRRAPLPYRCYQDPQQLLRDAQQEDFTLYLLDVVMPGTDGIETARQIRSFNETAQIVFLTTSKEFAYESYRVHALDYLLKPIDANSLFAILDDLYKKENSPSDALSLKCGTTLVRIPFHELCYVEVNGKHLFFNTTDGTVRQVFGTLREYEPKLLCRPEFHQVHRSYIVNLLQVEELTHSGLRTFTGKYVPVSRLLYPQLQKEYMRLLFDGRGD